MRKTISPSTRRDRADPDSDVRGMLAAYAADLAMLGRTEAAFAVVEQAAEDGYLEYGHGPTGSRFVEDLRAFLAELGYLPAA